MDKVVLKFLADILYIKEIINMNEYEDILDARNHHDLDQIAEKMLGGGYNGKIKKGESYSLYGK